MLAAIALACLSAVGVLAALQHLGGIAIDRALFDGLHLHATPALLPWVRLLDAVGYWYGVVPFGAALAATLAALRRWRDAAFATVALGAGLLLNAGLKLAIGRARPLVEAPAVFESTLSFPSGHAQAAASAATVLVLLAGRPPARAALAACGAAFALAVGVSRIAAGVHFPLDVVAGWLLGVGWACAIGAIWRRTAPRAEATGPDRA